MTRLLNSCVLFAAIAAAPLTAQSTWNPTQVFPSWQGVAPTRTIDLYYDNATSSLENGARLRTAIFALQAGDQLRIGPGVWSSSGRIGFEDSGTAAAPIWVVAMDLANRPVITRPDASQNTINIGRNNQVTSHLCLRGLEVTGGSDLIRLTQANNIWIDQCYIHDGHGVGVAANTWSTSKIYVTRNEIARPGDSTLGEACYFGSHNGSATTSFSVFAFNHIHSTTGSLDGDGIEIKQGSHSNWVYGNLIHDTRNPAILVYGTWGNSRNVIENNFCYRTGDNVIQVQGDALVMNNVAIDGQLAGFGSHDHVAASANLQVIHNTFISRARAVNLQDWNGRNHMVFANNIAYSRDAESIHYGAGSAGVAISGNVVFGNVVNSSVWNYRYGAGIGDFVNAAWDASALDVTPIVGGEIDNRGTSAYAAVLDQVGTAHSLPVDPGARANSEMLIASNDGFGVLTGGTQQLSMTAGPGWAGAPYIVIGSASGTGPGIDLGSVQLPLAYDGWFDLSLSSPNTPVFQNTTGQLDSNGGFSGAIALPPLPIELQGIEFNHVVAVWRGGQPTLVSNPVSLRLQ